MIFLLYYLQHLTDKRKPPVGQRRFPLTKVVVKKLRFYYTIKYRPYSDR